MAGYYTEEHFNTYATPQMQLRSDGSKSEWCFFESVGEATKFVDEYGNEVRLPPWPEEDGEKPTEVSYRAVYVTYAKPDGSYPGTSHRVPIALDGLRRGTFNELDKLIDSGA